MKRTQRVTLSVSSDVLRHARLLAARKRTTLSALVARALAEMVTDTADYEQARERNLALLEAGLDLGTHGAIDTPREALHDRLLEE